MVPIKPINSSDVIKLLKDYNARIVNQATDEETRQFIDETYSTLLNNIMVDIRKLPTVRAFDKTNDNAYWEPAVGLSLKCSSCGQNSLSGKTAFCPHCGTPMGDKEDVLARLQ